MHSPIMCITDVFKMQQHLVNTIYVLENYNKRYLWEWKCWKSLEYTSVSKSHVHVIYLSFKSVINIWIMNCVDDEFLYDLSKWSSFEFSSKGYLHFEQSFFKATFLGTLWVKILILNAVYTWRKNGILSLENRIRYLL